VRRGRDTQAARTRLSRIARGSPDGGLLGAISGIGSTMVMLLGMVLLAAI
jgi:hypothetical protein